MKMTLSSPTSTNTTNERQTISSDPKSLSPNSSPRTSPRPSPRPQTKIEHNKSDPFLTVNYKESSSSKHDGSVSSHEGSISGCISSTDLTPPSEPKTESAPSTKDRKENRAKKKPSWFNSLYPTYKSRSEDFKRIFKEVPDDERLVVDYSCALQKEILVHGRLYVSQNYLCFYANIFGWETNVTLKWKEVTSISKEKTAIVIPNAVLISTRTDQRFFFTSLVARDKTYVMLFRVWQNALMDQPMTASELWQWVHQCYGEELGLTSDDEDYIAPGTEEDKLSVRSIESFSENESGVTESLINPRIMDEQDEKQLSSDANKLNTNLNIPPPPEPTDSESDIDRPLKIIRTSNPAPAYNVVPRVANKPITIQALLISDANVKCTASHAGRQFVHQTLPIHIDELFTLLFTSSKFYLDFHAVRKTTDLTQTPWTHNPLDNSKSRVVSQTIALSSTMGPKTAQVTEYQTMLPCSKAGYLYSINVKTQNAGVPYADSFVVLVHYCLKRVSDTQSLISIYGQITYKKHVWGLVKGMIEKNCWSGLDDFFGALLKALYAEAGDVPDKKKMKRRKRTHSTPKITEKTRTYSKSTTTGPLKIEVSKSILPPAGGARPKVLENDDPDLSIDDNDEDTKSELEPESPEKPQKLVDDNEDDSKREHEAEPPEKPQKITTILIGGEGNQPSPRDFNYAINTVTGRKKTLAEAIYATNTVSLIVFVVLLVLVFLNVMLYMKLWSLEETPPYTVDLHILQNLPKSHEEWIQLLQRQESLHTVEVKKWQNVLKNAVNLLRQAEESLMELQLSIYPTTNNKFTSMMQNDESNIVKDESGEL